MPISRLAPAFVLLGAALASAACADRDAAPNAAATPCDTSAIRRVVTDFGDRMKLVSLQSPDSALAAQIDQAFADLVTPQLLAAWRSAPARAPGRLTSSPWPDRIEIDSIRAGDAPACVVHGTLVFMTSVEATGGGAAAREAVRLTLQPAADSAWRIADYHTTPTVAH